MVDFLTKAGRFLGISNQEGSAIGSQLAQGNIFQAGLTTLASLGGEGRFADTTADVSGPPAGVDSTATLSELSRTGRVLSQFPVQDGSRFASSMGEPISAGAGVFGLPGLITGAARTLSRPGVGGLIGGAVGGAAIDTVVDMFGNRKKLIITRKLQRDVKKVFMLSGGNIGFVSANSMRLFNKSLSEDQIVEILFKTFKNQGPYVTKAAVRKTRSTIRKMETLCDLKDRLCPPKRAPARRRMPAKSTTITNVR